MKVHGRMVPLYVLTLVVAFVAFSFLATQVSAAGGSWKPAKAGEKYKVTLKDAAGNEVMGELSSEVAWDSKEGGGITIKKWDAKATFNVKAPDGKMMPVKNEDVKKSLTSLNPDMTGTLSGNVLGAPAPAPAPKAAEPKKEAAPAAKAAEPKKEAPAPAPAAKPAPAPEPKK